MNRPLVIYHDNCADGFAAAWCFWRKYGKNADYVPASYRQSPPDVKGRDVYLVDFSYKREVVERMLLQANSVCLIDHHATALRDLQPLFLRDSWAGEPKQLAYFTDLERSGATLAWDYLFPQETRPLLLGHIEDRDLWRFKLAGTREISSYVYAETFSFEAWDRMMAADGPELLKMTSNGAAITRKHNKDVKTCIRLYTRRMTIHGYTVPVANVPLHMASDVAGQLAHGDEPFAATYVDRKECREFSLRSSPTGLDVSLIAEAYGGGGHARAAGFAVERDHPLAKA